MPICSEADREKMRELRKQGISVGEISRITGFSASTVYSVTKDVPLKIVRYRKELPVGIVKGTIIDIETTGLNPETDEIITFGYLEGSSINVVQRFDILPAEYYHFINERLGSLPQPLYAYNADFERSFLMAKTGIAFNMIDIFEPFKKRADANGRKYPRLDELAPIPREYFGEKTVPSRQIPTLWQSYVKTKDKRCLSLIVRHVMEDLVQALYVLAHTPSEEL